MERAFCILTTGDDEMSEPVQPEAVVQVTAAQTPEAETVEGEKYDAARAMALIEKLRAEIKELKPKAKQAEELSQAEQKRKEAEMTEMQKLQAQLEKANADLKATRLSDLRRQAAIDAGLPLAFADRLKGETPDELKDDAKKLLAAIPAPKPPNLSATNPGAGASQGETPAQALARIHGQSVNIFDPRWVKEHGGGVVIKDNLTAKE
jgi:hypothetical protein